MGLHGLWKPSVGALSLGIWGGDFTASAGVGLEAWKAQEVHARTPQPYLNNVDNMVFGPKSVL